MADVSRIRWMEGGSVDTPAPGDWSTLPPIARAVGPAQLTAATRAWARSLAARQRPKLALAPLRHDVSLHAPAGLAVGLARVVAGRRDGPPLALQLKAVERRPSEVWESWPSIAAGDHEPEVEHAPAEPPAPLPASSGSGADNGRARAPDAPPARQLRAAYQPVARRELPLTRLALPTGELPPSAPTPESGATTEIAAASVDPPGIAPGVFEPQPGLGAPVDREAPSPVPAAAPRRSRVQRFSADAAPRVLQPTAAPAGEIGTGVPEPTAAGAGETDATAPVVENLVPAQRTPAVAPSRPAAAEHASDAPVPAPAAGPPIAAQEPGRPPRLNVQEPAEAPPAAVRETSTPQPGASRQDGASAHMREHAPSPQQPATPAAQRVSRATVARVAEPDPGAVDGSPDAAQTSVAAAAATPPPPHDEAPSEVAGPKRDADPAAPTAERTVPLAGGGPARVAQALRTSPAAPGTTAAADPHAASPKPAQPAAPPREAAVPRAAGAVRQKRDAALPAAGAGRAPAADASHPSQPGRDNSPAEAKLESAPPVSDRPAAPATDAKEAKPPAPVPVHSAAPPPEAAVARATGAVRQNRDAALPAAGAERAPAADASDPSTPRRTDSSTDAKLESAPLVSDLPGAPAADATEAKPASPARRPAAPVASTARDVRQKRDAARPAAGLGRTPAADASQPSPPGREPSPTKAKLESAPSVSDLPAARAGRAPAVDASQPLPSRRDDSPTEAKLETAPSVSDLPAAPAADATEAKLEAAPSVSDLPAAPAADATEAKLPSPAPRPAAVAPAAGDVRQRRDAALPSARAGRADAADASHPSAPPSDDSPTKAKLERAPAASDLLAAPAADAPAAPRPAAAVPRAAKAVRQRRREAEAVPAADVAGAAPAAASPPSSSPDGRESSAQLARAQSVPDRPPAAFVGATEADSLPAAPQPRTTAGAPQPDIAAGAPQPDTAAGATQPNIAAGATEAELPPAMAPRARARVERAGEAVSQKRDASAPAARAARVVDSKRPQAATRVRSGGASRAEPQSAATPASEATQPAELERRDEALTAQARSAASPSPQPATPPEAAVGRLADTPLPRAASDPARSSRAAAEPTHPQSAVPAPGAEAARAAEPTVVQPAAAVPATPAVSGAEPQPPRLATGASTSDSVHAATVARAPVAVQRRAGGEAATVPTPPPHADRLAGSTGEGAPRTNGGAPLTSQRLLARGTASDFARPARAADTGRGETRPTTTAAGERAAATIRPSVFGPVPTPADGELARAASQLRVAMADPAVGRTLTAPDRAIAGRVAVAQATVGPPLASRPRAAIESQPRTAEAAARASVEPKALPFAPRAAAPVARAATQLVEAPAPAPPPAAPPAPLPATVPQVTVQRIGNEGAPVGVFEPTEPSALDLDRLADRLYSRLRTRLRSELLVDRERAGLLPDLR